MTCPNSRTGLLVGAILAIWLVPPATYRAMAADETNRPDARRRPDPAASLFQMPPHDVQVAQQVAKLESPSVPVRAGACEALGFLRAYGAADALVGALTDPSYRVQREAAMALAWCGGRDQVVPLLTALDDQDWLVRQAVWVSLTNLTGMEWPFDGMGQAEVRSPQADAWRRWWESVPTGAVPSEVFDLAADADIERRLRGVRALGSLGGDGAVDAILEILAPYRRRNYNRVDSSEKQVVQSCLRSLGRLGERRGQDVLIGFLDTPGWARYAADALGDFGGSRAVGKLIEVYPRFARDLSNRRIKGNLRNPKICPADDRFSGNNTQDRMHETPFAIASALARLPLDDPRHVAALREITPHLLANVPSDWDSGMLYKREAFELVTAYLLERAGLRRAAIDAAFEAASRADEWLKQQPDTFTGPAARPEEAFGILAMRMFGDVPYMGRWLPALCRDQRDVPPLIGLLEHDNGWLRINAAKALMLMDAKAAVEPMARLLGDSKTEAEYGYSGALEHAEYDAPAPRWREALIRGLGRLGAKRYDRLLVEILEDPRNAVDIHHAAAMALDELDTPEALKALRRANRGHLFHSVRMVAREALWRRGLSVSTFARSGGRRETPQDSVADAGQSAELSGEPEAIVFIKGNNTMRSDFNGQAGVDPWRQTYTVTNSGPTMRVGRNLYVLRPANARGEVTRLTHFQDGFVADCEVSWDGRRILFARRLNGEERNYKQVPYEKASLKGPNEALWGGPDDPWWHIWEINVDGTGLRQITRGPVHDVQPAYLPDGRIVFSSSRLGLRDEYHGFPSTGLTVMNADGSDIHAIGFNLGGDREPAVMSDGRIVFSRLDNFYSRLKTEITVQTAFPDGTRNVAFYGPERRAFWKQLHVKNAAWTIRPSYGGSHDNRNRVLRLTQPQPLGDGRVVCASSAGLVLLGPQRFQETMIPHDRKMAVTSPFPLDSRRLLCAATIKQFDLDGRLVTAGTDQFERLEKGPDLFRSATNIDLGLYILDVRTGRMTLLYNDPEAADFEARPIMPRARPKRLAEPPTIRRGSYTARLFCNSAKISRESRTAARGKLVRVIEGVPIVSRHETQKNRPTNRWKNHGGTHARVLGTAPLAADGSFFVEVPADRLLHLQVLDGDRRVVNNQIFWMYARPGETRSCVGCHENPRTTSSFQGLPPASTRQPIKMLPSGDEFTYRAKAWLKGVLPDECEERNRTVRAVSLMGRY